MPRHFDLVLFDLGSTLVYFEGDRLAVLAQADLSLFQELVRAGCMLDPQEFIPTFRRNLQAYFQQREIDLIERPVDEILRLTLAGAGYPDLPSAALQKALRSMYAVTEAHWKREVDALPVLAELKRQGYRLGLISNAADAEDIYRQIRQHELQPWLEQVLISAEVGWRKPHPAIFRRALDFFAIPPGRAVMVGDTLSTDVAGARGAGLASVWLTRRAQRPDNHPGPNPVPPDASIDALAALPELLQRWDP